MILCAISDGYVLFRTYTKSGLIANVLLADEATRVSNRMMLNRHGNLEANRQVATVVCRVAKSSTKMKTRDVRQCKYRLVALSLGTCVETRHCARSAI